MIGKSTKVLLNNVSDKNLIYILELNQDAQSLKTELSQLLYVMKCAMPPPQMFYR